MIQIASVADRPPVEHRSGQAGRTTSMPIKGRRLDFGLRRPLAGGGSDGDDCLPVDETMIQPACA